MISEFTLDRLSLSWLLVKSVLGFNLAAFCFAFCFHSCCLTGTLGVLSTFEFICLCCLARRRIERRRRLLPYMSCHMLVAFEQGRVLYIQCVYTTVLVMFKQFDFISDRVHFINECCSIIRPFHFMNI